MTADSMAMWLVWTIFPMLAEMIFLQSDSNFFLWKNNIKCQIGGVNRTEIYFPPQFIENLKFYKLIIHHYDKNSKKQLLSNLKLKR
jgi:hypothetical protein